MSQGPEAILIEQTPRAGRCDRRPLSRTPVNACDKSGWVIPFTRVTTPQAGI